MRTLIGLLVVATTLHAHEGIHAQIDALTKRIAHEPRNASLRLERGELYRLHREWQLARADYDAAAKLDPSLDAVLFARARMELESGHAREAKALLDRFLARAPQHADAHLTRARTLVKLGRKDAAIADYDAAIAFTDPPNPDLYFERARTLGPEHLDAALRGLDEGLARLGNLVSLQQQALDLAIAAKREDEVRKRRDAITSALRAAAGSAPPSTPEAKP